MDVAAARDAELESDSVELAGPDDEQIELHPAFRRFVSAVDREVDAHLPDEVVEARLASVRREAVARAKTRPAYRHGFVEELVGFGYSVVCIWLRVVRVGMEGVAAMGGYKVHLDATDVDELAKDTVARALIGFRDDAEESPGSQHATQDLRAAFLSHCVRKLPEAYTSRRLRLGHLEDGLDAWGQPPDGVQIVDALGHCITDRNRETVHLLQSWTDSSAESQEIIDLTRRALDIAARAHADVAAPLGGHTERGASAGSGGEP
jgi:hypothetical protein